MSWASPPAPPWAPPWRSWWGWGSFLGSGYVGLVAFAGAFLVSMWVIALANIGGRATSVKLILAGTALSAICAAVSNFFLYVINTSSGALEAVVRWTMGSLAAASWDTNLWMLAVSVLGALFFWTQYRTLNLMLLGDEAAVTLGNRSSPLADCLSPGGVPAGGLCGLYGGHHRLCGAGYSPYGTHSLWNGPQKADSHQRPCWGQSSFCGPMYSAGWCSRARRSHWGADRLGGRAGFHLPDGPEEIRLWRWRLMDHPHRGCAGRSGGKRHFKGRGHPSGPAGAGGDHRPQRQRKEYSAQMHLPGC